MKKEFLMWLLGFDAPIPTDDQVKVEIDKILSVRHDSKYILSSKIKIIHKHIRQGLGDRDFLTYLQKTEHYPLRLKRPVKPQYKATAMTSDGLNILFTKNKVTIWASLQCGEPKLCSAKGGMIKKQCNVNGIMEVINGKYPETK